MHSWNLKTANYLNGPAYQRERGMKRDIVNVGTQLNVSNDTKVRAFQIYRALTKVWKGQARRRNNMSLVCLTLATRESGELLTMEDVHGFLEKTVHVSSGPRRAGYRDVKTEMDNVYRILKKATHALNPIHVDDPVESYSAHICTALGLEERVRIQVAQLVNLTRTDKGHVHPRAAVAAAIRLLRPELTLVSLEKAANVCDITIRKWVARLEPYVGKMEPIGSGAPSPKDFTIYRLFVNGVSQYTIADSLKMSRSAIWFAVERVKKHLSEQENRPE